MKKRVLALLMVLALVAGVFAGCGGNDQSSQGGNDNSTPVSTPAGDDGNDDTEPVDTTAGPADVTEHYSFTTYYNYEGWNKQFGLDETSAYLANKFNIDMNWYGPDSDANAKLNLMVSSNDLPESIIMDRSPTWMQICRGGYFQDLQQYMYPGNTYEQDVAEGTREMLKVDGGLYGVPNWSRKGATGGNFQWVIQNDAYEAAGSPALNSLEDLHQFALTVKDLNLKSYTGQEVLPFWCTNTDNGFYVYQPFYRALGQPNIVMNYFTQENGVIEYCLESEDFIKALKEANKWYNEGLYNASIFTDNGDQFLEKITNGRPALMWYDFSQESNNHARQTMMEQTGGASTYEVLGHLGSFLGDYPQFPPADGVEFCYGDETGGIGWNVNCVTTVATDPQRIFDLWTYMITPEFSAILQYGPEGGSIVDHYEINDEGLYLPVFKDGKLTVNDFDSDTQNAAGLWFWSQPAQSDYVDGIKFAINNQQDYEIRDWVVDIQANLCSYTADDPKIGQKFMTDENTALDANIDQQSDLGVAKQAIEDQSKAMLPKILMAANDAEFDSLVNDLLTFVKSNMIDELKAEYQTKHDANVAAQGYSAYSKEYDVYKLG